MSTSNFSFETFECPVCMELPEKEIFLCKNGHNICGKCSEGLTKCPQCREPYSEGKTRNRNVESFLATVEVACQHGQSGCPKKLPVRAVRQHEQVCEYNKNLKICELLGFRACGFSVNWLKLSAVMDHLEAKHGVEIMGSANIECILCGLTLITGDNLVPCAVKLLSRAENGITSYFLLCPHLNREFLFVNTIHLADSPIKSVRKFQARFFIKSETTEIPDLEWSCRPMCISQLRTAAAEPIRVRIPLALLLEHYVNREGHLRLNVEIS